MPVLRSLRERFERESRLTAAIDHPNVIPVYTAGEEAGRLYLVMRYVAGTDLRSLLERDGRLAPTRAADVVAQVGAGQIVLGSDYPYPWQLQPVDHIFASASLSDDDKADILGRTAAKLFGFSA